MGVYVRQEDNAEYCFQEVSLAQGADVECEAPSTTPPPPTSTASPPPMSSTIPSTSMSSKAPSTPMSSTAPSTSMSSIPPLSELHENATNLVSQKAAHEQALTEATAKKTEAHALSNELDNA